MATPSADQHECHRHVASDENREDRPRTAGKLVWGLGCLTVASLFVAAYFAGQASTLKEQATADVTNRFAFPPIDATAAVTSEKFSMATGFISDRAEGLFVLDHNSGLLQCSVMYPRIAKFLGLFTINVHDALGSDKNARYMMTTGLVDIPNSNSNPVASSVIYILNTTTGVYACYGIPFNRTLMNSNKVQQGTLRLLATGSADPVIDRDSIR